MDPKKVLTFGGGSGQCVLLSGLRDLAHFEITSVVSMVDSGGSTGRLRNELGILPPGDALKCILALSPYRNIAQKIFLKKFNFDKRLNGHNAGNMLLSMLERYTGSFPASIQAMAEILEVQDRILPVTIDKATLVAELTDGTRIYGETAIDVPRGKQREKIKSIFLVPHHNDAVSVYPPVVEAIDSADYIVIGPGDLFTSILASLVVPGVKEALQKAQAKIFYIINIMTKFGETHHYKAGDFFEKIEETIGRTVDGIIYNTKKPDPKLLEKYREENSEFVEWDQKEFRTQNRVLHSSDLLDASDRIVRHDSKKLALLLKEIIDQDGRIN